jgi:4-hydroxybenzoate polyprenyltransferase
MKLSIALKLGRVSNLPTVWSNVLAAAVLAGGEPFTVATAIAAVTVSVLYIGGMYLNDAFDRDIDASERPDRPIPSRQVSANTVFGIAFLLLLTALAVVAFTTDGARLRAAILSAEALAAAIVIYDWSHKANTLSPLLMGLCRVLAYVTAAYMATPEPNRLVFAAALAMLGYLIGLTYIAKQEALDRIDHYWPLAFLAAPALWAGFAMHRSIGVVLLWLTHLAWIGVALYFLRRRAQGDVPRAVILLIAGICLVDALFLAGAGAGCAAGLAISCFFLTLILQRWVIGT